MPQRINRDKNTRARSGVAILLKMHQSLKTQSSMSAGLNIMDVSNYSRLALL